MKFLIKFPTLLTVIPPESKDVIWILLSYIFSVKKRGQVSNSYITTGNIVVLYILFF